ncbi:TIGR04282 family arsenosugar biosynthesis glycosyltransferase [Verrucomicrobia bacterium]|nr:TIGR04282 family arsenosugar biosynthesis glycosyltransferase [Verrucomicrobiota bacterium]
MWQHWLETTEQSVGQIRVVVFVKAPREGYVKTRLAESLGDEGALNAYVSMVDCLIEELAAIPYVQLRYAPADAKDELAPWMRNGWESVSQCDGGLGEKLTDAFESAFSKGIERVVVIGSDCPYVTLSDLQSAVRGLDESDVVLGPSVDGGYWLVALKAPCTELFEGIDWSTEKVFEQTEAKAVSNGLKVFALRQLEDIDTQEEWQRFIDFELEVGSP